MAWSLLLQGISNLIKGHRLMALNTFKSKCWNVSAAPCCMKISWCLLLYVCSRNRTGCLVSCNFTLWNFTPWSLILNHNRFSRLEVHRVTVFLLWCSLRQLLENHHQSVSAEGERKRKIKLEIMCWFPCVQLFFLILLKLWGPHAVEQNHEISAGEWARGDAAAIAGNISGQQEILLREAQGT